MKNSNSTELNFTLIYKSEAADYLDAIAINKIFKDAQISNKETGITGCLLHHHDQFIQLLEGERDVVLALFDKIKKDTRHNKVRVLSREESGQRIFGDWNMIYSKIEDSDSSEATKKRQLFDDIFHSSDAVRIPGTSKLTLWIEVNKILNEDIFPVT